MGPMDYGKGDDVNPTEINRRRQSETDAKLRAALPGWWWHSLGTWDRRTLWNAGPVGFGTAVITEQPSPDKLIAAVRGFEARIGHHLDETRRKLADVQMRVESGGAGGYARDEANVLAQRVKALEAVQQRLDAAKPEA